MQGTGYCSLAPAHSSFCGVCAPPLNTSSQKDISQHLNVGFYFVFHGPQLQRVGVNTDQCDGVSPEHRDLFESCVRRDFPKRSGQPLGLWKDFCNKLNRCNTFTAFHFRKVMQPSNVVLKFIKGKACDPDCLSADGKEMLNINQNTAENIECC